MVSATKETSLSATLSSQVIDSAISNPFAHPIEWHLEAIKSNSNEVRISNLTDKEFKAMQEASAYILDEFVKIGVIE